MAITHVIRGDDHLTNAFRQTQLYQAAGWGTPQFAHIPLIHGPDGAKLSKRHGALGVDAYRDMGYLPEALTNYLLRLGWSHGDDETISRDQAIAWFGLESVGRSPARFDFAKLGNLNGQYLKQADDARLAELTAPLLTKTLGREPTADEKALLARAMPSMKERAKTLVELADGAAFFFAQRPLAINDKAAKILDEAARGRLAKLAAAFAALTVWDAPAIEGAVRALAEAEGAKLGDLAQPLRAAVTGSNVSPPIFEVLALLGREESLARIGDVTTSSSV
jgi:glutamyl-tRNA synthetase